VSLVTQDAHIKEVTRMLQESVAIACRIYAFRNAASIGSAPGTRRTSVNAASDAPLTIESLDEIIFYVQQLDFQSRVLDDLSDCAKSLKMIRTAVIDADWEYVHLVSSKEDIVRPILKIAFAQQELNSAKQEAHNRITANKLEEVLGREIPSLDTDFDHEYLATVIEEAEESDITAMATQQLLECAKHVYLLRVGLSRQDNKQVAHALRWFGVNAYRCPTGVQEEAQKAFIMHQNSLLYTGLTAALQTGYATGELGDVVTSTVDPSALSKLLTQANDVKYQTDEVKDMVDVAEMIYCLRCAQKAKDPEGIFKALNMLGSWGRMLPSVVVEEVAFARSEQDNAAAIEVLRATFSTFDITSSASLEMSLNLSGVGIIDNDDESKPVKKALARRYSYACMNRADIDFDTIDTDTLDDAMEEAREYGLYTDFAKDLFKTVLTIRNLRYAMKQNDWPSVEDHITAWDLLNEHTPISIDEMADKELQVIRNQLEMRTSIVDLSKALKSGWARCSNGIVDTDTLHLDSLIDAISRAERSMQDLGISSDMKKLNLRYTHGGGKSDIVAALTAKDDGPARIMGTVSSPALKRYRKHFPSSLDSSQPQRKKLQGLEKKEEAAVTAPKSKLQEQVERLLLSAAIVAEVRKALYDGEIQLAGELSEEALNHEVHSGVQEELTQYATEIGRALHMMRLCKDLNEGIVTGNGETLDRILQEARDDNIPISGDLGIVRSMEKALAVLKAITKTKKELNAVAKCDETNRFGFSF
jgi:hypothetical protein